MGFVYDELPPAPRMMLREEPVFAAFLKVRVLELNYKSYFMFVFVVPKGEAAAWTPPAGGPGDWQKHGNYAGGGAIFGGKGADCGNCVERDPYNVLVEVQDTLKRLNLKRDDAVLKVMCEDEVGDVVPLESTPIP